jgi:hypothetical protein
VLATFYEKNTLRPLTPQAHYSLVATFERRVIMMLPSWVYCSVLLALLAYYTGDLVSEIRFNSEPVDVSGKVLSSVRGAAPPLLDELHPEDNEVSDFDRLGNDSNVMASARGAAPPLDEVLPAEMEPLDVVADSHVHNELNEVPDAHATEPLDVVVNGLDPYEANSMDSVRGAAPPRDELVPGSVATDPNAIASVLRGASPPQDEIKSQDVVIQEKSVPVPVILELSWKERMLSYFSSKECQKSPPDYQPPSWLKQMFVLIGVQKGGTKAIHTFLEENPQFVARCDEQVSTKELFFFNNITDSDKMKYIDQGALQAKYSHLIQNKCPVATATLVNDAKKMYLDDTPLYIQDSHLIPQLLNCVMPKTKIMAVLRNPTERAFSHYNFYLERDWCKDKSFDEWVDINIRELTHSGVLTAKDPFEELLAWERYNEDPFYRNSRRCKTFVTRGMYAIQLLHFVTALEASNRPRSDLHVIHSEDLQGSKRQQEYDKILSFLDLPPHTLEHVASVHKTVYESSMDSSTRKKLEKFYGPFNLRLYKLLDWDPVWE